MTLLLTLEHGPRPQARYQAQLDEGELVIGRSAGADWHIDDPDMFVSRTHCTLHGGPDGYFVTDTSSSGLFVNSSSKPLGPGNSMALQHGMRLRVGDYIFAVEIEEARLSSAPAAEGNGTRGSLDGFDGDDFFSTPLPERSEKPRPASLPDPFEQPDAFSGVVDHEAQRSPPPAFDDPFSLDPLPSHPQPAAPPVGFSAFDDPVAAPAGRGAAAAPQADLDDAFDFAAPRPASGAVARPAAPFAEDFAPAPPAPSARGGSAGIPRQPEAARAPAARFVPAAAARAAPRAGLDAFLRAAGIDPGSVPDDEVEAAAARLGREYRAMMDGLMLLLRKRAEEKNNARVAATVVGASDVNPLKFMPRVEDAMEIVVSGRSPGFLSGEAAIDDAVRDLAHHHLRAWRGIQAALRRMIDRFDPAKLEEELKAGSAVGTLLAGGRGAKLWELYKKRHREISRSAEERFMGEVGADFRNAYEEE